MKDDEFQFEHCPECGGSIKHGGLFTNMGMVCAGRNGKCQDCGKEWHVIWDNSKEWKE